jgi:lysophospholipase L1-like esterase
MARRLTLLAGALSFLFACVGSEPKPTAPPTWVTVPATDPSIQYTGRVELSSASAVFSYPGVSVRVRFQGDALELLLKDHGAGDARTTNYYQVILDGGTPVKLAVRANQTVYELAKKLPPGEHTVELIKLTETEVGRSELQGFRVHGRLLAPPARPTWRLEFIGDSITCGYGTEVSIAEAQNPTTGFHSINQNVTRAYGWLTARELGAEAVTVCYSGRGVYRNNTGSTTGTVPQLYDHVLPGQSAARWDFTRYAPDLVVINLGTNDFVLGTPDATRFMSAYKDFLTRLRGHYPQARIICAVGPILSDAYPPGQYQWSTLQAWVSAVVKDFNDRGDTRVHYLAFERQTEPYGEDWHPSATTHAAMASRLASFIRSLK